MPEGSIYFKVGLKRKELRRGERLPRNSGRMGGMDGFNGPDGPRGWMRFNRMKMIGMMTPRFCDQLTRQSQLIQRFFFQRFFDALLVALSTLSAE